MVDLPKRPITPVTRLPRSHKAWPDDALERAAANGGEGWIYHQDSARADRANGVTIAEGIRTQVLIDGLGAGSTDELDTIPRETATPLLASNKFMPIQQNDNYLIRFGFSAAMIDPGLSSTEEENGITIEYDVGGQFTVHEAYTTFSPDPGPLRREDNGWTALNTVGLLAAVVAPRVAIISGLLSAAVNAQNTVGQKFIEFGQAFAGASVVSNGVAFYVTPTTDIVLWGADVTITRLSSPTE